MSPQAWLEMVQLSVKSNWFGHNKKEREMSPDQIKNHPFSLLQSWPETSPQTRTAVAHLAALSLVITPWHHLHLHLLPWKSLLLHVYYIYRDTVDRWVFYMDRVGLLCNRGHFWAHTATPGCQIWLCGHRRNRLETFNRRYQNPASQPDVTLVGLTKVNTAYSGADMNVSWKFIVIRPIKCPEISLETTETNLVVDIQIQPTVLLPVLKKEQSVALDSLVRACSVSAFIVSKTSLNNTSLKHWNILYNIYVIVICFWIDDSSGLTHNFPRATHITLVSDVNDDELAPVNWTISGDVTVKTPIYFLQWSLRSVAVLVLLMQMNHIIHASP